MIFSTVVISLYHYSNLWEVRQRPWRNGISWLALHGLLLPVQARITNVGMALPTVDWTLTYQSTTKLVLHRLPTDQADGGNSLNISRVSNLYHMMQTNLHTCQTHLALQASFSKVLHLVSKGQKISIHLDLKTAVYMVHIYERRCVRTQEQKGSSVSKPSLTLHIPRFMLCP